LSNEYRVIIDRTNLEALPDNRSLEVLDLVQGQCTMSKQHWKCTNPSQDSKEPKCKGCINFDSDVATFHWPPPEPLTRQLMQGPARVPTLQHDSTSFDKFMHDLKTMTDELPNSGEMMSARRYRDAFAKSSQLMLQEGGCVGSGYFTSCYGNFCRRNNLSMVPELKAGFKANTPEFLRGYGLDWKSTNQSGSPWIGCVYNVAKAPEPLQLPDDVSSTDLMILQAAAAGKSMMGVHRLLPDADPQVRQRKAQLLLRQIDEGSASSS